MSMNAETDERVPLPEPVRAEAAVWLARLHSDTRSEATESGFRSWLAADPSHRAAFERMTNTWEAAGNLRQVAAPVSRPSREFWPALRRGALASAATLGICAVVAIGALIWVRSAGVVRDEVFATAVGERRSLLLEDGSHLVLDTDSRVRVSFAPRERRILLEQGQARFQVAHDTSRPFIVRAGAEQIIAVGTVFDVRWTNDRLSVVLVQGQVAVVPTREEPAPGARSAIWLHPGERLDFERPSTAVKSQVRLEREEAWVGGRVIFESTPLREAIAEMNRYAPRPLVLSEPVLGDLRISGSFSVDDSAAFARALAQMFSLTLTNSPDRLVLGRAVH